MTAWFSNRAARAILALGCAGALSGCVIGRVYRNHPLDEKAILGIQRGVTTKAQILATFGPPQEVDPRELVAIAGPVDALLSRRGDKPTAERLTTARYLRYTFSRGNAFGIVTLLFNYLDFDQKNTDLVIFFNSDDTVEDYAFADDTQLLPRFGFWSR